MNQNISQSNSLILDGKIVPSLSEFTISKNNSLILDSSFEEIKEIELRIINWLHKHEITITVPEEKEFQYYENCRKNSKNINSFDDRTLGSIIDSPLLQRRKSLKDIQLKSPVQKKLSSPKLSKFQTYKFLDLNDKDEIFPN